MVAATALAEVTTPPAAGAALDIEQVSHAFDIDGTELPVLSDVSISVEPGELGDDLTRHSETEDGDGLTDMDVSVQNDVEPDGPDLGEDADERVCVSG